jgi:hypothetical protein
MRFRAAGDIVRLSWAGSLLGITVESWLSPRIAAFAAWRLVIASSISVTKLFTMGFIGFLPVGVYHSFHYGVTVSMLPRKVSDGPLAETDGL